VICLDSNLSEYEQYQILEHWKPVNEMKLINALVKNNTKEGELFLFLYTKIKEAYKKFPDRKDKQDAFIHPLNVVWNLKKSKITDYATLCAGLMHDYIEESVDVYEKTLGNNDEENTKALEIYVQKLITELRGKIIEFSKSNNVDLNLADEIIEIIKLLTRKKRDFYYKSISGIFSCKNELLKEKAIQVKLADRIHNIQCLNSFESSDKVYQCFKNIFILNNTKKYLMSKSGYTPDLNNSTIKLFKKCCKSTYDACLQVCNLSLDNGIKPIESMLQLAFYKFVFEQHGLGLVTSLVKGEVHPMRLYREVIKKYDSKLHQEKEQYKEICNKEMGYCKKFFSDFNFNDSQLNAIINYKDSFALKEVITCLLYDKQYSVLGFGCSELCHRKMMCKN